MSNYIIAAFPQNQYRFALYENTKKQTWQQIRAETGCHALCNLGYYTMSTFKPSAGLIIGGKTLAAPIYHEYGVCIDSSGHLTCDTENSTAGKLNYCVAQPPMMISGKRYVSAQDYSKNGTTMIGIRSDSAVVALLCGKDIGMTSTEAVEILTATGCVHILRYDGSWSTQGSLGAGLDLQPSQKRIVHNYLLVFQREEKKEEETPAGDIGIVKVYSTKNPCYAANIKRDKRKAMLHSTGTPGANAKAILANWDKITANAGVEFVIDNTGIYQALPLGIKSGHCGTGTSGQSANNTHVACELCEPLETRVPDANWYPLSRGGKSNTVYAVRLLQQELFARGYLPNGIDGSFGPGCEAALKAFQKDAGLVVDGSCGLNTLHALQKREKSFLAYQKGDAQPYFDAVYDKAVALFAWLIEEVGGKPEEIICHCEGYQQGVASNHADVLHWFPQHGKTMDSFRADVKAAMEEGEKPVDTFLSAVDKLTERGVITSPDYWKDGNYSVANVQSLIIKMADTLKN